MRDAALQHNSNADKVRNLSTAERLVRAAAYAWPQLMEASA